MANDHDSVKSPATIADLPDQSIAADQVGQDSNQAKPSSVDFSALEKDPNFIAFIDKQVQSKSDKRLGQYGTKIDSLEDAISKFTTLTKGGLSEPEALAKMQGEQTLAEIKAELASLKGGTTADTSPGGGEKSWAEKQQAILENAGIEKNDPRIVELLRTSESKQDFIANLEESTFAWKQADAKKPQPSQSTVANTMPSVPSTDMNLEAQYNEELSKIKRGDISSLNDLKAKYRELGLQKY